MFGQVEEGRREDMNREARIAERMARMALIVARVGQGYEMKAGLGQEELFNNEMRHFGFRNTSKGEYELRNRDMAHGDNCSDDERNDGFYDSCNMKFNEWADPILKKVEVLAKKNGIKIETNTSSEYGTIWVNVE